MKVLKRPNHSKIMKRLWLIERLRLQSGLKPISKLKPSKQTKIIFTYENK